MADVIPFKEAAEKLGPTPTRFTFKPKKMRFECPHAHINLNESSRLCECKDCGDTIDPFDVLIQYCDGERKHFRDIERFEAAKSEFEKIQSEWSLTIAEKRRIDKAAD